MAEQPYVTVSFKFISEYKRKNRVTRLSVTRLTAKAMIGSVSLKGHRYFARCETHNITDGPYTSTAIVEPLMSRPWLWCDECAKIAGVELPKADHDALQAA